MTEDMTFAALCRIPFLEMRRLIILNNEQGEGNSNKALLENHGWTLDTYHTEWLRWNKG